MAGSGGYHRVLSAFRSTIPVSEVGVAPPRLKRITSHIAVKAAFGFAKRSPVNFSRNLLMSSGGNAIIKSLKAKTFIKTSIPPVLMAGLLVW
jgi:hypothetical protein